MQQGERPAFAIQRRAAGLDEAVVLVEPCCLGVLLVDIDTHGVTRPAAKIQQRPANTLAMSLGVGSQNR